MEDHSVNSIMSRGSLSSNTRTTTTHESPEESSWTMYLQDFLINNNHGDGEHSFLSSYGYENYSIISDAGSSVTRKLSTISGEVLGPGMNIGNCNRSSFKFIERNSKEALLDDALEDTASSPVNSPKVCNLSQSGVKPTLRKDNNDISNMEKGSSSGRVDERNELAFIGKESDCTELKKRGLCLVPFSMVANYFG